MMQQEFADTLRWYDHYNNIRLLITLSEELPRSVQENIGLALNTLIPSYKNVAAGSGYPRSLGTDTVLRLYKSGLKRRWYDSVPQLYKAINMLITLPDVALQGLDKKCELFVEYIQSEKRTPAMLHTFAVGLSRFVDDSAVSGPKYRQRTQIVEIDLQRRLDTMIRRR